MSSDKNIVWHNSTVSCGLRSQQKGQKPTLLWFTGLSSSGKSTLAHAVDLQLYQHNCHSFVLDGDNVRHGLCSDLGFSDSDRKENIRRVGEVSKLILESGIIVMAAFISPFRRDRDNVRSIIGHEDFIEIYCKASLLTCESRDVKGFYKRARAGEIQNYTGIDAPYEEPLNPDLTINTEELTVNESVKMVFNNIIERGIIKNTPMSKKH